MRPRLAFIARLPCGTVCSLKNGPGVPDEEAGSIEHYQDFSEQGFDVGLTGFPGNQGCDLGLFRMQELLKISQDTDVMAHAELGPSWLCRPCLGDGGLHFMF